MSAEEARPHLELVGCAECEKCRRERTEGDAEGLQAPGDEDDDHGAEGHQVAVGEVREPQDGNSVQRKEEFSRSAKMPVNNQQNPRKTRQLKAFRPLCSFIGELS